MLTRVIDAFILCLEDWKVVYVKRKQMILVQEECFNHYWMLPGLLMLEMIEGNKENYKYFWVLVIL